MAQGTLGGGAQTHALAKWGAYLEGTLEGIAQTSALANWGTHVEEQATRNASLLSQQLHKLFR